MQRQEKTQRDRNMLRLIKSDAGLKNIMHNIFELKMWASRKILCLIKSNRNGKERQERKKQTSFKEDSAPDLEKPFGNINIAHDGNELVLPCSPCSKVEQQR